MIKFIVLTLILVSLPLNAWADIVNVLDKSTVLVPRTEFDSLLAQASLTDSSLCSIEQVNMRLTDNGIIEKPALLEIDYLIKIIKKDRSLVPCLFVRDGSLTLLSASTESGPVNVQSHSGTYSMVLNGEGTHRVKLMFNVDLVSSSGGYLSSVHLGLPESGQAWCQIDLNAPYIKLHESFGDLNKNLIESAAGFTSSSFIKNRSSIKLVWSRGRTLSFDDGFASIVIREPGRIVSDYLYPMKDPDNLRSTVKGDSAFKSPSILRVDPSSTIDSIHGYVRTGKISLEGIKGNPWDLSLTDKLTFSRCGDYILIDSDRDYQYLGLKVTADPKLWKNLGSGRYAVPLPVVSPKGVKTDVFISTGAEVDILSVRGPGIKESSNAAASLTTDQKIRNAVFEQSGVSPQDIDGMKHQVFLENQRIAHLRVRALLGFREPGHVFAVSGFESNIFPSSDGLSIMVHERFGIINRGSTVFPLPGMGLKAEVVAAYSSGVRVAPFELDSRSISTSKEATGVAIPLTFFGSISKPSKGMVDIYYSVDTSDGTDVSLYGFQYVKTKSKVTLHLMKGWTGDMAVSDSRYELGEFNEESLLVDPSVMDSSPLYPLSLKAENTKRRTYRLAPVESMPVGLKATLHQMASIPSGDNSDIDEKGILHPDGSFSDSKDSRRISPVAAASGPGEPLLYISLLAPSTGRIRLEFVFFAFFGLLYSFSIKNETLGARVFGLSALVLLSALFYGPFDQNVMMTLVAALVVAGLTWISFFILKKCSIERDCND